MSLQDLPVRFQDLKVSKPTHYSQMGSRHSIEPPPYWPSSGDPTLQYDHSDMLSLLAYAKRVYPKEYEACHCQEINGCTLRYVRKLVTVQTSWCLQNDKFRFWCCSTGREERVFRDHLYDSCLRVSRYTETSTYSDLPQPRVVPLDERVEFVEMSEADYLDVTIDLQLGRNGYHPAILVSGHQKEPGGTYFRDMKDYACGIEEDMYRRTSILFSTTDPSNFASETRTWNGYTLPASGGIYVPQISVLRRPEEEGYAWIAPSEREDLDASTRLSFAHDRVSVILCACEKPTYRILNVDDYAEYPPYHRFYREPGQPGSLGYFDDFDVEKQCRQKYKSQIIEALKIALDKNHDSLVVPGPFGSMLYPPFPLGCIWKEVLSSELGAHFRKIVFVVRENNEAKFRTYGTLFPMKHAFFPEPPTLTGEQIRRAPPKIDHFHEDLYFNFKWFYTDDQFPPHDRIKRSIKKAQAKQKNKRRDSQRRNSHARGGSDHWDRSWPSDSEGGSGNWDGNWGDSDSSASAWTFSDQVGRKRKRRGDFSPAASGSVSARSHSLRDSSSLHNDSVSRRSQSQRTEAVSRARSYELREHELAKWRDDARIVSSRIAESENLAASYRDEIMRLRRDNALLACRVGDLETKNVFLASRVHDLEMENTKLKSDQGALAKRAKACILRAAESLEFFGRDRAGQKRGTEESEDHL